MGFPNPNKRAKTKLTDNYKGSKRIDSIHQKLGNTKNTKVKINYFIDEKIYKKKNTVKLKIILIY